MSNKYIRPVLIIGISKQKKDPSHPHMEADTIGNYVLACCNVLWDDEAFLNMPRYPSVASAGDGVPKDPQSCRCSGLKHSEAVFLLLRSYYIMEMSTLLL